MVISGWNRRGRVLRQHAEEDRDILLFVSLTLGVAVMVIALWCSTS